MREKACQFGEQNRLNGIVTHPAPPKNIDTVLITVSAGVTSKVGPYRLYTQLARHLAAKGISTLRFDLGGIGNSAQIYPGKPLVERTDIDIRDAVDYVQEKYEPKSIVLGGLCSGA